MHLTYWSIHGKTPRQSQQERRRRESVVREKCKKAGKHLEKQTLAGICDRCYLGL